MEIKNHTVVSLRYIMKTEGGEVMEDNREGDAVQYVHGCNNILPALEAALAGLKAGEQKMISLNDKQLNGTLYFDILIDNVRPATPDEIENKLPAKNESISKCGPDCCCC